MNEEISRILQLLEEGKINAEEAEKLIRAIRETGAKPPETPPSEATTGAAREAEQATPRPDPFRDICELFSLLGKAIRRAARRRRRFWIWTVLHTLRTEEEARRRRAETKSVYERVRYVLKHIALVEEDSIEPGSRLREDLKMGRFSLDNLRLGLELEFRIDIPSGDLEGLTTVQAVVDYIHSRIAPTAPPEPSAPSEPPAQPESPAQPAASEEPEAPKSKKRSGSADSEA